MSERIARSISEVLAPGYLAAGIVAVVAAESAPGLRSAVVWGLQAVLFGAAVPLAVVVAGVRAGWWEDRHVRDRARRRWPLLVCLLSVSVGTATGLWWGAPRDLVALGASMAAVIAVLWCATDLGGAKPSVHTLVACTAAGTATVYFGALGALVAWPPAAAVAWSRVRLQHHTPPQVVGGAVLAGAALELFLVLR
ncbi:phosphatase PAP2 family protein [Nocardiopsis halophila]|uniref:phosphatase PAP2 family protein n=1 Tax=Nocardiopsis halophila TaxID=141692 RepID=UPI00034C4A67|nr:phosphatase PAP2 family protein [Nocardiopsis halophila]